MVAALLEIHRRIVRGPARAGVIRAAQPARRRCVLEENLVGRVRSIYPDRRKVPQSAQFAMIIDNVSRDDLVSTLGTAWQGVSDRVMGGVSRETLRVDEQSGKRCLRLSGDVRLDNNGGFIQMGLDLEPGSGLLDASPFIGLRLVVYGNGERYSVHLRTADVVRPWQSYRAHFAAPPEWREVRLPFAEFTPYRLEAPLDLASLRRIGVVAIGRKFFADLCVAEIAFYA